ncbi:MAG: hypothetical protein WCL71_06550 [Deltaproteobacteria bacterium]
MNKFIGMEKWAAIESRGWGDYNVSFNAQSDISYRPKGIFKPMGSIDSDSNRRTC